MMKKLAVIKIGARICFGKVNKNGEYKNPRDTSGGNGEARAIIEMLHRGGADITIMTNVADDDYKPEQYKSVNIIDLYNENKIESYFKEQNFDALVILNGSFTIFGGVEGDLVWMNIANYNAINLFPKTPYLILCDLALVAINNMWSGMISKKPWGDKYKDKQLDVTRDDIVVLTQAYDTKTMYNLIAKNKNAIKVKRENVRHFPFERFPSLYDKNYFEVNENPEYDLLYGGTMRGGRRANKLAKFYFGYSDDINVELFGKLKENELTELARKKFGGGRAPKFGGVVNYVDFCNKMHSSLSHIVVGDKIYEQTGYVPQRCYESICANVVTFIDYELDTYKRIFGFDEELKNFMYVKNVKDVENKIKQLKSDKELLNRILEKQHKVVEFDKDKYCVDFVNMIE